jgi:hypothetical protein
VHGTFSDLGEAVKKTSDDVGKFGDKGKEGTEKLKGGLEEALPLAKELRDVLQEIVTLGSQADI